MFVFSPTGKPGLFEVVFILNALWLGNYLQVTLCEETTYISRRQTGPLCAQFKDSWVRPAFLDWDLWKQTLRQANVLLRKCSQEGVEGREGQGRGRQIPSLCLILWSVLEHHLGLRVYPH